MEDFNIYSLIGRFLEEHHYVCVPPQENYWDQVVQYPKWYTIVSEMFRISKPNDRTLFREFLVKGNNLESHQYRLKLTAPEFFEKFWGCLEIVDRQQSIFLPHLKD